MATIAILGASPDRAKFGNKCVRAYANQGWIVYPVHPKATAIEGHACYASLAAVPAATLDRISVYLPPAIAVSVLDEIAAKPAKEVWLNPGVENDQVLAKSAALGLPIVTGCSIVDIGVSPHELV